MELPIPDISYKWNHAICVFLCLASFTLYNVFVVHPRRSINHVHHSCLWLNNIQLHGCITFCLSNPILFGNQGNPRANAGFWSVMLMFEKRGGVSRGAY